MKRVFIAALAALGLCLGCGDPSTGDEPRPEADALVQDAAGDTAVTPISDAGLGMSDIAVPPSPSDGAAPDATSGVGRDGGSLTDAAPPTGTDATPPAPDAASPPLDAAPPSPDAAPPSPDAAPPPIDAAPPAPDAAIDPCDDRVACLGFEGLGLGAAEVPGWAVVSPNCSGEGRITIEDNRPHRGERVMHVTGPGGYCNHVFLALQAPLELDDEPLHVRFYMRVARPLGFGHITFLAMHDAQTERDLRMGGQSQILMWNREIDDATLPELSPTGIDLSFAPVSNQWHCVEFAVDGPAGELRTWVDGNLIEGLVVDAEPTADIDRQWHRRADWRPALEDLRIGWESYGGDPADVWFDDIAVGTAPIGCLP